MSAAYMEITNVEWVILREIQKYRLSQAQVALTYAFAMRQGHKEYAAINRAIIERWSRSGLERVKKMAWKRLESWRGEARGSSK